jgi:hypothetical protein
MPTHRTIFCTCLLAVASSCSQPIPNCITAHEYPFAAEYTLTAGDPNGVCAQLPGDTLGIQTYYQEGGKNGTPDYRNALVAIRPGFLGQMIEYAEMRGAVATDEVFYDANAIGQFIDVFPNDEGFCRANEFQDSRVTLPMIDEIPDDPTTMDVDETQPAQPAIDATYRWSNARFVVSAEAQGTQFEADLEYMQDDCTAKYHVVGVYPAVTCQTDDECNDEKNGLNPDFAVRCNTELGLCVLSEAPPAYE